MADFKTHVQTGAAVAFFLTIGTYILEWSSNFAMAVLVFFTTVIGSFLPDMDSESGLPIQIIFGLYAYFAAGITFYFMYNSSDLPLIFSIVAPVGSFAIVIYIIRPLFNKHTSHRGIFHSVPAVLITFFATLFIIQKFKISLTEKFVFAAALAIGYLTHLVLDEVYSTNILSGKFKPKKSLGTALDFGFHDKKTATIAYLVLIILIALTYPMARSIYFQIFW